MGNCSCVSSSSSRTSPKGVRLPKKFLMAQGSPDQYRPGGASEGTDDSDPRVSVSQSREQVSFAAQIHTESEEVEDQARIVMEQTLESLSISTQTQGDVTAAGQLTTPETEGEVTTSGQLMTTLQMPPSLTAGGVATTEQLPTTQTRGDETTPTCTRDMETQTLPESPRKPTSSYCWAPLQ